MFLGYGSYAPPGGSTANGYWQPSVMSSPPVSYPTLPFQSGQQQTTNKSLTLRQIQDRNLAIANANAANGQMMSNQAFNWGDNKMVGADGRGFPNHTGTPNNYQINMGGMTGAGVGGNAGGGGFGGGNTSVSSLAQWYQNALNQANQANEARYRDVLGGYQSRYDRGLGMLAGLGQQEAKDINELYDAQAAKGSQDLIGRGLGNSTVMNTMKMGVDRERNADLGRLNDRMRQQAMSTDAGLSGDTLSFMERKTDKPPDVNSLLQLSQGLGQAGYGAGVGGLGAPIDAGGGYMSPGYGMGMMGGMMPFMPYYGGGGGGGNGLSPAQQNYLYQNMMGTPSSSGPVSSAYAASWQPSDPPLYMTGGSYGAGYDPSWAEGYSAPSYPSALADAGSVDDWWNAG